MKDTVSFPPLPDDDSAVYEGRRLVLNRIDQAWGCDAILSASYDHPDIEYCGLPEHDPFTGKCWDHGPGPLGGL